MHFAVFTQWLYTRTNYTPNRNIHPQCNRLCLNGGKRHSGNQVRQRTIIIILRLDFVFFVCFLITYHQSLLSMHSSCSFIPALLTILRLHFGLFFLITYHQSLLSIHSSCSFTPAILTILRLDFGLFFLITYHQSLLSIHSSCSFIPAILTILRLDFGLFFNNLSPPPYIHAIKAFKHNAQCRLLQRHLPYVTHYAPIYHCRGLLFRSPPYCGPLFCTRSNLCSIPINAQYSNMLYYTVLTAKCFDRMSGNTLHFENMVILSLI